MTTRITIINHGPENITFAPGVIMGLGPVPLLEPGRIIETLLYGDEQVAIKEIKRSVVNG